MNALEWLTHGGGELQWGVALQSWALWLARGLGLPFTGYAVDGATVRDVVAEQIPRAMRTSALGPDARYHVGCLYIGVNDVRRDDWEVSAFAGRHRTSLAYLAERCETVLALTVPLRLGRPATPSGRIEELNAAIEAGAWDVAFLAIDPLRATEIAFTAPYVFIEGGYMVRDDSALVVLADVERAHALDSIRKQHHFGLRERAQRVVVAAVPVLFHRPPGKFEVLGNAFVAPGAIDQVDDVADFLVRFPFQQLCILAAPQLLRNPLQEIGHRDTKLL